MSVLLFTIESLNSSDEQEGVAVSEFTESFWGWRASGEQSLFGASGVGGLTHRVLRKALCLDKLDNHLSSWKSASADSLVSPQAVH